MSRNFFRPYSFNIPAGQSVPLNVRGKYFRIYSASEMLVVTGIDNAKDSVIDASAGIPAGLEIGPFDPPFQSLTFSTLSGNVGNAVIYISDIPTNVSTVAGTVNIIDNASPKFTAVAGQGFGSAGQTAQAAAQYSKYQLRNPTGSGVNAIVIGLDMATGTSAEPVSVALVSSAADLATGATASNRMAGGAAPNCKASTEDNAVAPVATPEEYFDILNGANTDISQSMFPLVIPPGYALLMWVTVVNIPLVYSVQFEEWKVGTL